MAAWTPSVSKVITPYVAQAYNRIFSKPNTIIRTASAERTFWEKVTILHHEANRPENLAMPVRYSRHYYDLYCIGNSQIKKSAFCNIDYELAVPGTLRLIPPEYRFAELRKDYISMANMMFGDYPDFDSLMLFIGELEKEINLLR